MLLFSIVLLLDISKKKLEVLTNLSISCPNGPTAHYF
jgi:hypothetical protein